MGFMKQQVVFGEWYEVETDNGTDYFPAELVGALLEQGQTIDDDPEGDVVLWDEVCSAIRDYVSGKPESVKLIEGWGARLSAPGYMDCTDWCVFETEQEAKDYLEEMYGDEDGEE